MSDMASPHNRWLQGAVGAALMAVGLFGLNGLWQETARAQPTDHSDRHETMHDMMDAMHGDGTAERMHEVEGAEEMMDQCASMMGQMGMSREGMMDGGGMPGMGGMMGSR